MPAVTVGPVWLALSAAVAGAAAPGIVPVVLGRVRDLLPGDEAAQRIVWSWTTIAFALFQAGGAYLDSFLFARGGAYATLFALGAAALAFALTIDLAVGLRQKLGRIAA
jgi:predicted MFS family arabinose efflux permease